MLPNIFDPIRVHILVRILQRMVYLQMVIPLTQRVIRGIIVGHNDGPRRDIGEYYGVQSIAGSVGDAGLLVCRKEPAP